MTKIKKIGSSVLTILFTTTFLASCSTSKNNLVLPAEQPIVNIQSNDAINTEFDPKGISKSSVLVKLKNSLTKSNIDSITTKYNSKLKRTIPQINILVLQIPKGKNSQTFINELSKDTSIAYVEPDIKVYLDDADINFNDPMLPEQYALKKVEASKAWTLNSGKDSVIIGMIDTGVDLEHPDLKAKLLPGYNAIEPGSPPKDDARHGTHTAGIAAAIGNNGIGVAGLAANCKILPVKVLGSNTGSIATISDGLVWAADHGADVVNMSLGTYTEEKTLGDAVKYALSKNVVCIATMGNDNTEKMRYPASFPGMIAVGSTDENDKRSNFSNYGPWMTVSAPGSNILSTLPTYMSSGNSGYGKLSGTSMAAPLVTGLAGLIRSQHSNMSPADVKKVLQDSTDDLGDIGYDKYFGAGRINAFKAVQLSNLK